MRSNQACAKRKLSASNASGLIISTLMTLVLRSTAGHLFSHAFERLRRRRSHSWNARLPLMPLTPSRTVLRQWAITIASFCAGLREEDRAASIRHAAQAAIANGQDDSLALTFCRSFPLAWMPTIAAQLFTAFEAALAISSLNGTRLHSRQRHFQLGRTGGTRH